RARLDLRLHLSVGEQQQAAGSQLAVVQHVSAAGVTHSGCNALNSAAHIRHIDEAVLGVVDGSLERHLPFGEPQIRRGMCVLASVSIVTVATEGSLYSQANPKFNLQLVSLSSPSSFIRMQFSTASPDGSFEGNRLSGLAKPFPLTLCQPALLRFLSSARSLSPSHRSQPQDELMPLRLSARMEPCELTSSPPIDAHCRLAEHQLWL
uniref:SHR-BD domain-containing protein n=1 Tax=Macrostomum lignano TaxID=282301 RepID=A0A1I8J4G2_9PLAT